MKTDAGHNNGVDLGQQLGTFWCRRHLKVTMELKKVRTAPSPFVISENCLPRRIHALLSPKWTSMVLYVLHFKTLRTGELIRAMPGISKKMLTQTLRKLESLKLIHRKVHQVVPPMVEYSLTDLGVDFVKPLLDLYSWAEENSDLLDEIENNQKSLPLSDDR